MYKRQHELYNDSPVKILVDHPEGIKDTCLYVLLTANEEVVVTDPKGEVIRRGHFSESISMGDYCISVEKNEEYMGKMCIRDRDYSTPTVINHYVLKAGSPNYVLSLPLEIQRSDDKIERFERVETKQ